MNITELARILRITPQELRDSLPQLGFDIGQKAIKINKSVANKIIREWPILRKRLAVQKQLAEKEKESEQYAAEIKKIIKVPNFITVRDFSNISGRPVNIILSELMKNGIFVSLNEKIDFETAWLIGSELGLEVKIKKSQARDHDGENNKLKKILDKEDKSDLRPRPPVIVVMGHVDHGKTKLLDAIRRANVIDSEAGGITQHIGAYQVVRRNQLITFIDTPGHEAFTAMRGRGAKIADIAILVVAADDGVKPQTIEAYRIIEAAKIPFVVAINKIDKPGANIDKTKQKLSNQLKITPEDWGGKIICAPISAKDGTGIVDLLDMVLLTAETEAKNIKANANATATGTVIESHIDKGAGPMATILVQNGTMKIGDQLILDNFIIGKVRGLNDYQGKKATQAEPAMPAQIIGLKAMPQVGDIIEVGEGEKTKHKKRKGVNRSITAVQPETVSEDGEPVKKINVIIKSDVLGSAEAIEESLEKISTNAVKIKIIRKGLGNITDGDIKRAEATKAQIIGFNVKSPPIMEELAREKNIKIKLYSIIYDLLNDIKKQMQAIAEPTIKQIKTGELKVLAIFRTEKDKQIIGGKVADGNIKIDSLIEIWREQELIDTGKLIKLQAGRQDVDLVEAGQECGIEYEGRPMIQEGDILHFYKEERVIKDLRL